MEIEHRVGCGSDHPDLTIDRAYLFQSLTTISKVTMQDESKVNTNRQKSHRSYIKLGSPLYCYFIAYNCARHHDAILAH